MGGRASKCLAWERPPTAAMRYLGFLISVILLILDNHPAHITQKRVGNSGLAGGCSAESVQLMSIWRET